MIAARDGACKFFALRETRFEFHTDGKQFPRSCEIAITVQRALKVWGRDERKCSAVEMAVFIQIVC